MDGWILDEKTIYSVAVLQSFLTRVPTVHCRNGWMDGWMDRWYRQ